MKNIQDPAELCRADCYDIIRASSHRHEMDGIHERTDEQVEEIARRALEADADAEVNTQHNKTN